MKEEMQYEENVTELDAWFSVFFRKSLLKCSFSVDNRADYRADENLLVTLVLLRLEEQILTTY